MNNKEYKQLWYQKNKERIAAEYKEKYNANPEYYREKTKNYNKLNPDLKKQRDKQYNENNKEKVKIQQAKYYKTHADEINQYKKEWAEQNKERLQEYRKDWYNKNRSIIFNKVRIKIKNNPKYALAVLTRKNILTAFRDRGFEKPNSTTKILGCTFEAFKTYLESKFEPWMTWENRGLYNGQPNYGWDIDHIIPLSKSETVEDVIRLNHYTNLQPLCSYINRVIKRDHI